MDYAPLLNWKNEGSLHGNLALKDSPPSVTDFNGKIAIVFKGQELHVFKELLKGLMSNLDGKAYPSVAVMVSDNFKDIKWHQVVTVSGAGQTSIYVDGKLDASKTYEGFLEADFKLRALSLVVVYDQNLILLKFRIYIQTGRKCCIW